MSHWHIIPRSEQIKEPWTAEELAIAHKLMGEGAPHRMIADATGRSLKAVARRLAYERMTPAQREARRERINAGRNAAETTQARVQFDLENAARKPAKDIMIERDRKAALRHPTLTAALLGDPLPGYSALDKRAVAV